MKSAFRWLAYNLGLLALALFLAIVVWVSAVIAADPNETREYSPVDIQVEGLDKSLLILNDIPTQAHLRLQAPRSIWDRLNSNPSLVKAWIDLTGLGPGEHSVPVKTQVDISPVRYQTDPEQINLTLEPLMERALPIDLVFTGNVSTGYRLGDAQVKPDQVTVSGPESGVGRVSRIRARVDVSGAAETIKKQVQLEGVDEDGRVVSGITISPREVAVQVPVSLLGGYKNAAVKVITKGQVAAGYRLTNILVSPPTVTLFSDNPQLIEQIPGFVETEPVDLSSLVDDIELSVGLSLPPGITAVNDQKVVVQVGIAALEGSLTLSVPVEYVGLAPNLRALVSPSNVDIIISGPLNILDRLTPANFRVVLDLTDLGVGVYQRQVVVDQAPQNIVVETTLPEIVEVTIAGDLGVPPTGMPESPTPYP